MTPDDVAEGRRLLKDATTRPWTANGQAPLIYGGNPNLPILVCCPVERADEDADLIVWAVNHLDELLTLAETAQQDGAA